MNIEAAYLMIKHKLEMGKKISESEGKKGLVVVLIHRLSLRAAGKLLK